MFKVILLIFVSIYFLTNFIVQLTTSYLPFKKAQTINVYDFYLDGVEKVIQTASGHINSDTQTGGTIDINYQGQILEGIEYEYKIIKDIDNNDQKGISIKAPWKINNRYGNNMDLFIPIIEHTGSLIFVKNVLSVDKDDSLCGAVEDSKVDVGMPLPDISDQFCTMFDKMGSLINNFLNNFFTTDNIYLDNIYLNIGGVDFLQSNHIDSDNPPYALSLNSTGSFYQQLLYENINTGYLFGGNESLSEEIFTNTGLSNDPSIFPDNIFDEYEIKIKEERISGGSAGIEFGNVIEEHHLSDEPCIEAIDSDGDGNYDFVTEINNAISGDTITLCEGTHNITDTIEIYGKNNLTIRSRNQKPETTIINASSNFDPIFQIGKSKDEDISNNITISGIQLTYEGDEGIVFGQDSTSFSLINNIFDGNGAIVANQNSNKIYSEVLVSGNFFDARRPKESDGTEYLLEIVLGNTNNTAGANALIENNYFLGYRDADDKLDKSALRLDDAVTVQINNNDFIDLKVGAYITSAGNQENEPDDITLDGNYIEGVDNFFETNGNNNDQPDYVTVTSTSSTEQYIEPVGFEEIYTTTTSTALEFGNLYLYKLFLDYQIYQEGDTCFIDLTNKKLSAKVTDGGENILSLVDGEYIVLNDIKTKDCSPGNVKTGSGFIYLLR